MYASLGESLLYVEFQQRRGRLQGQPDVQTWGVRFKKQKAKYAWSLLRGHHLWWWQPDTKHTMKIVKKDTTRIAQQNHPHVPVRMVPERTTTEWKSSLPLFLISLLTPSIVIIGSSCFLLIILNVCTCMRSDGTTAVNTHACTHARTTRPSLKLFSSAQCSK